MQKREPLIHFKRDLCFLKLTGKSNLKVRKSYSSGSHSSSLKSSCYANVDKNAPWAHLDATLAFSTGSSKLISTCSATCLRKVTPSLDFQEASVTLLFA